MTEFEDPEFLIISPAIPWTKIRAHPALNGHLHPDRKSPDYRYTRVSGPQDRDSDGYPWDDEATKGPVDRLNVQHWWAPEPEGFDDRVTSEIQEVVDDFPEHEFTGAISLFNEHTPLRLYRRVTVVDRRVVLQRPTVTWEQIASAG